MLGQQILGARVAGWIDTMKGRFEPSGLQAVILSQSKAGVEMAPGDEEDE